MEMRRTLDNDGLQTLLQTLPSNSEVELQCLSYGLREVGGSVCGVERNGDTVRIVLEAHGVRSSATVGSVDSIRCKVSPSTDADSICRGLPHLTPVTLETRSGDSVYGYYAGLADETPGAIRLDRGGEQMAVPVADVLSISLDCT